MGQGSDQSLGFFSRSGGEREHTSLVRRSRGHASIRLVRGWAGSQLRIDAWRRGLHSYATSRLGRSVMTLQPIRRMFQPLFELFAEGGQLLLNLGEVFAQLDYFCLQLGQAIGGGCVGVVG